MRDRLTKKDTEISRDRDITGRDRQAMIQISRQQHRQTVGRNRETETEKKMAETKTKKQRQRQRQIETKTGRDRETGRQRKTQR
jgi:hypothetical protein